MDLKTLIEKLLTVAPPGAVVKGVEVYNKDLLGVSKITDVWYEKDSKTIVIKGG